MSEPRGPDFVIVGAMKAGTTTLFRWLGEHPDVVLPEVKEPHFLGGVSDRMDEAGYYRLFADVPAERVTGEASAGYADARHVETVADHLAARLPAARVIYLVRSPMDRLRSHYGHEVRRGRERRPLATAVSKAGNPYVARSAYGTCAEALAHADRESLLVVRTDRLEASWPAVLQHLRLAPRPCPATVHNQAEDQLQMGTLSRWLWRRGLLRTGRVPAPLRRLGRRLLSVPGQSARSFSLALPRSTRTRRCAASLSSSSVVCRRSAAAR